MVLSSPTPVKAIQYLPISLGFARRFRSTTRLLYRALPPFFPDLRKVTRASYDKSSPSKRIYTFADTQAPWRPAPLSGKRERPERSPTAKISQSAKATRPLCKNWHGHARKSVPHLDTCLRFASQDAEFRQVSPQGLIRMLVLRKFDHLTVNVIRRIGREIFARNVQNALHAFTMR